MEAEYNIGHAREILVPFAPEGYLKFDERGVWPAIEHDPDFPHESDFGRWRPAEHLDQLPDAPEPDVTPMLPNPFTGRELAAFMLDGTGAWVRHEYGEWASGPDDDKLSVISKGSNASRAVTEAFDAYRHAIAEVGKWDEAALTRRDAAHKAYAESSNDKALLQAFNHAEAEWQAAYQAWLTAMVRCLLEPESQAATEAPVPARARRRTAWEVASPYMVHVLKSGQFSTAKELYRALELKAGPDSPFDTGTGAHRGRLFVRDVALPLALRTVQNRFNALRELARTSTP